MEVPTIPFLQNTLMNSCSSGLVLCTYTLVNPALKYSSMGLMESSIEVIIGFDFFNCSSETSFAFSLIVLDHLYLR